MKQVTSDLKTIYLLLMNTLPAGLTAEEIKFKTALRNLTVLETLDLLISIDAITVEDRKYRIANDFLKEYLKSIE